METVDLFAIVLALAVLIGCINYAWVRLPPAIGMLLGSLVVSLLVIGADRLFHLHIMHRLRGALDAADLPHFFLDGTVALLLFAGSLHVDVAELNRRRWLILLLATASVVISTSIFGYGIYFSFALLNMAVPAAWCLVLGAVLAPTDAVVVENLMQRSGLPAHLRAAIVGESLFNDGAGVVLFLLALGVTRGDVIHFGHGRVVGALAREIAGGAMLGIVAGWLAAFLLRRVKDEGLQLLISLALVLGCYRVATLAALSGPIAVVTAGLCLSSPSCEVRHAARYPRGADRLLVAAQSDPEHHSVSADGTADPRSDRQSGRSPADPVRRAARGRVAACQCRGAAGADRRKLQREAARYDGADLGRPARRHIDRAGAHLARLAVANRASGHHLRGGGVHHRHSGLTFPHCLRTAYGADEQKSPELA